MAPDLKPATFRIDRQLLEKLDEIRRRDGVPISEQVRRAITAWLEQRGERVQTAKRRAGTRRKA
jgi:metal-responsive CopG/Arc/MetJ family transcriptional regulator